MPRAPRPPYCDLALSEGQLEPQTQRERVATAAGLGWGAVAVVHQAGGIKLVEGDR